jgi:hypothetical protein
MFDPAGDPYRILISHACHSLQFLKSNLLQNDPEAHLLAAERHIVVQVEQVGPASDIFASFGEFADSLGKILERFGVAVRTSLIVVTRPLLNFPRVGLVLAVRRHPVEHFAVASALRDFRFKGFRIDAREFDEVLVHRAVVMVFAIFADDGRAAFVEHPRKDDITAETDTHAARSALSEIRCEEAHNVRLLIVDDVSNGCF